MQQHAVEAELVDRVAPGLEHVDDVGLEPGEVVDAERLLHAAQVDEAVGLLLAEQPAHDPPVPGIRPFEPHVVALAHELEPRLTGERAHLPEVGFDRRLAHEQRVRELVHVEFDAGVGESGHEERHPLPRRSRPFAAAVARRELRVGVAVEPVAVGGGEDDVERGGRDLHRGHVTADRAGGDPEVLGDLARRRPPLAAREVGQQHR